MTDSDMVVVLTALNVEYEAVLKHLENIDTHRLPTGTRFEIGTVPGTGCRVALGLTGTGNSAAAVLAERATNEFCPAAIFFVGVAGALWDSIGLGDVVVASRVYAYHGGTSEDDGLKARPRSWEAAHEISQLTHHLARTGDWTKRLTVDNDRPTVRFGPIAAGEIVQNSRISREAQWIRDHYNDATAIEMEAAGVAQAGHLNSATTAIIRGISDRADGTKTSANDRDWQPRAATHAAAFAIHLATQLVHERAETMPHSPNENGGNVFNVSSGTVGIQASKVSDSTVWINTTNPATPPGDDLIATVTSLRGMLDRDRDNDEIDDDTYAAARNEIDTAEGELREPGGKGKKKALLALKRLSGLATGTTNVAGNIAQVITAVNGLS